MRASLEFLRQGQRVARRTSAGCTLQQQIGSRIPGYVSQLITYTVCGACGYGGFSQ